MLFQIELLNRITCPGPSVCRQRRDASMYVYKCRTQKCFGGEIRCKNTKTEMSFMLFFSFCCCHFSIIPLFPVFLQTVRICQHAICKRNSLVATCSILSCGEPRSKCTSPFVKSEYATSPNTTTNSNFQSTHVDAHTAQ